MLHWIDTLALVGILINLLKGADLLLRPNQQKWIQSKFESITLGLDDLRPIQWYSKLRQAFVVEIIYMLTALIVFFRMSAIIRWLIDLVPPLAASKAPPWWAYVLVFVIMVLIFDSKYRSQEAIDWILCKNRPHDETIDPLFFVLRFVAVLLRFVAVICLIVAL